MYLLLGSLLAQPIIQTVIVGQKRSALEVLERLTLHPTGEGFNETVLLEDIRRLSRSPGIVSAWYRIDTLPEGLRLVYEIKEGISRYPVAMLGGLEDNFWWVLGYEDQNWQGRGQIINARVRQTDGRLGGKLSYYEPYYRDHDWGFGFQVERYASREPLYFGNQQVDYFYDNHNIGLNWHYNFKPEQIFDLGFTYFREDYEKATTGESPGPDARTEYKQLLRLAYGIYHNRQDILQPEGHNWQASAEWVFQRDQVFPFYLFRLRRHGYYPVGQKSVFATRMSLGYSTNKNTPFAPFVLDSRVNIRGVGNRVDRGTALAVLNLEYRQHLLTKPWLHVQGVAFFDLGSWREPGGRISDLWQAESVQCFSGLGVRLISPQAQQAVLRIDYGWGIYPRGGRGIVVGLGQFF